jgi:hypothetical protein
MKLSFVRKVQQIRQNLIAMAIRNSARIVHMNFSK